MKHTSILCLLLLAACITPIWAQTVEVILIQDEAISTPRSLELSEFVVSGGLDTLFEAGFIATNERPVIGTRNQYLELKPTYETLAGSIDYLILVFARYTIATVLQAPELEYRIMQVNSRAILKEGVIQPVQAANQSGAAIEKASVETGKLLVQTSLPFLGQ
jgi:hypothetical protein